ncbi:hypothetical protein IIS_05118 [Bacillus cereus VD131]|nr:hypothetical protein IIS_05118 [Bacillus cereus VD131]
MLRTSTIFRISVENIVALNYVILGLRFIFGFNRYIFKVEFRMKDNIMNSTSSFCQIRI